MEIGTRVMGVMDSAWLKPHRSFDGDGRSQCYKLSAVAGPNSGRTFAARAAPVRGLATIPGGFSPFDCVAGCRLWDVCRCGIGGALNRSPRCRSTNWLVALFNKSHQFRRQGQSVWHFILLTWAENFVLPLGIFCCFRPCQLLMQCHAWTGQTADRYLRRGSCSIACSAKLRFDNRIRKRGFRVPGFIFCRTLSD